MYITILYCMYITICMYIALLYYMYVQYSTVLYVIGISVVGLGSQSLLWIALEKTFIESEGRSFPFTYPGIYILMNLVNSLGRKMFCFLFLFVFFVLLKLRRPDKAFFD